MALALFSLRVLVLGLLGLLVLRTQEVRGDGVKRGALRRGAYFRVRRDFRECAPPLCGGFFVSLANRGAMRCSDGVLRRECYVADLRPGGAGVAGVARGRIGDRVFEGFGNLGELAVETFFRSAVSPPPEGGPEKGFFARLLLQSSGVRCLAPPCFDIKQVVLNAGETQAVSRVDLDRVGATSEQVQRARKAMAGPGLIAFGDNRVIQSGLVAGDEVVFIASEFYLPSCDAGG